MSLPPKAVLLDLGNVLVFHDNALLIRRLGEAAGRPTEALRSGIEGELSVRINTGQLAGHALHEEVTRLLGGGIDWPTFVELWSSHFTVHHEVMPLVEALLTQVPVALVSNTNALHMEWLKPRVPILERFATLVLSHEVGVAKPDPRIFEHALARLGVAPAEAVFFDDIAAYVNAARTAGLLAEQFTDAPTFRAQLRQLGLGVT